MLLRFLPGILLLFATLISPGNSWVPQGDYYGKSVEAIEAGGRTTGKEDAVYPGDSRRTKFFSNNPSKAVLEGDKDSTLTKSNCSIQLVVAGKQGCNFKSNAAISKSCGHYLTCEAGKIMLQQCNQSQFDVKTCACSGINEGVVKSDDNCGNALMQLRKLQVSSSTANTIQLSPNKQQLFKGIPGIKAEASKDTGGKEGDEIKGFGRGKRSIKSYRIPILDASRTQQRKDFALRGQKCGEEGKLQEDDETCNKFKTCVHGKWIRKECGPGTLFSSIDKICDFPSKVDCMERIVDYSSYGCDVGEKYTATHPDHCHKFIECDNGRIHIKSCGPKTLFNPETSQCDHSSKVKCRNHVSLEHDLRVVPRSKTLRQ